MCHLQKLDCYLCRMKLIEAGKYELQEDESAIYMLQVCEEMDMKFKSRDAKIPKRFHCPNIQWPPEPDIHTHWICEDCLCQGYQEYRYNVKNEEAKKEFEYKAYHHRHIRTPSDSSSDTEEEPHDQYRNLPENYQLGLKDTMKQQVLELFEETYDIPKKSKGRAMAKEIQTKIDNRWMQRASEADHRLLTLHIPHCNLCKMPLVMADRAEGDDDNAWLADIEYEPNSTLRKWMFSQTQKGPIQLEIQTCFAIKPCPTCISREFVIRRDVSAFIEKNSRVNWIGWMVFNWLMTRGIGSIPMFEHATVSVGFPNTRPPTLNEMLSLMAARWKQLSGVAWEDVGELQLVTSCTLSFVKHEKPFTSLEQWPTWQPDIPLEMRSTLPSLSIDDIISDNVEGLHDDDEIVLGTKRRADGRPKSEIWGRSSRLLMKLQNNHAMLASMERSSGLSTVDMNKALGGIQKVLQYGRSPPYPGAFQFGHPPTRVQLPNAPNQGARRSISHPKKMKKGGEANNGMLFTIKGAYFDENIQGAVPKSVGDQFQGGTSSTDLERASTPPVLRAGVLTPEMENPPLPQPEDNSRSNESGQQETNKKRVRFSDPHEIDENASSVFCGRLLGGDVLPSEQADDVLEMPVLAPDELGVYQCELGHTHILEAGENGSAPGELVFLPLGSFDHNSAT